MSFLRKLILLIPAFLPFLLFAEGIQPVVIRPNASHPLGLQIEYYQDKTGSLTISDLITKPGQYAFMQASEETLNFGPTTSACWVRFYYSTKDTLKHFLEIGNSNLNTIDFFVVSEGKVIRSQFAGLARSASQSREVLNLNAWLFELPLADGKVNTVYIRVTDQRRVIIPLEIIDLKSAIQASHRTDFVFGLYFGSIGIIAVLNIFFFFYFREKIYIFYFFHIFSQILINGILKGYLLSLFGSSLYFLSPYVPGLAGISNIFFILFSLVFLDVRKSFPQWHRLSLIVMILPVANIILNVAGFFTFSAKAGVYIGLVVCVWLFILGLVMYAHRVTQARFYIVGWGSFLIGLVILNAALNGWLPVNSFTYNAAVFGTLLEVLLISSALADRINLVRMERQQERAERMRLIEQQNEWLEENVKHRTLELTHKNAEIEAQNEELKQQHEELSTTHELLEKQKRLVEEKNHDIQHINQSLERKVQERTLELEETVKSLIKQNHDLEQFSYIVSHNMRAPVARILGLLHLMELQKAEGKDRELLMEYLRESAVGLDQIIHDLSQIIAIRKGVDTVMEKIDLEKVLKHNQSDLTDEILKADAEVRTTIMINELVSVKGYIQSILYNLLSNAIKYRSPDRKLLVDINIYESNGSIYFKVSDNGLGINLEKSKLNEIFHLYKRIHTHVQGKGLGLYLVKTQVEGLHGTVDVQTDPGIGTTFIVRIPKNMNTHEYEHQTTPG